MSIDYKIQQCEADIQKLRENLEQLKLKKYPAVRDGQVYKNPETGTLGMVVSLTADRYSLVAVGFTENSKGKLVYGRSMRYFTGISNNLVLYNLLKKWKFEYIGVFNEIFERKGN